MKHPVNVHATCVALGGKGVLLLGASGTGKSDLALRLIGRGAVLVADDRCDLAVERGRLVARPPRTIAGTMEVRGLGLVEIAYAPRAVIRLAVDLSAPVERLPDLRNFEPPTALKLPSAARPRLIALNAFESSAPDKIILALRQVGRRRRPGVVKPL